MQSACAKVGRPMDAVALMAVSKGQPPDAIAAAVRAGVTLFGESKVQEAKAKISLCPASAHWTMIGHLQSNKCRDAVFFFEGIHSVDSLKLAQELNKWADKRGKTIPILIEVNVAGEASKDGYVPGSLQRELAELNRLRRLELHGLMTVPPWSPDPERSRGTFRQLRQLKEECEQILGAPMPQLSMGMSGDFEVGIEEGATMVRLGTILFGPRRSSRDVSAKPREGTAGEAEHI